MDNKNHTFIFNCYSKIYRDKTKHKLSDVGNFMDNKTCITTQRSHRSYNFYHNFDRSSYHLNNSRLNKLYNRFLLIQYKNGKFDNKIHKFILSCLEKIHRDKTKHNLSYVGNCMDNKRCITRQMPHMSYNFYHKSDRSSYHLNNSRPNKLYNRFLLLQYKISKFDNKNHTFIFNCY